ncbi:MAG: hypothetical protein CMF50_09635 [Legionellales bacterium]|nr:hypothetical protein [Legionellales bacterium]|tara:strand:- start:287 stop:1303 length:1017 start_codon:yes stop_codon:yes gene_type:complete
MTDQWQDFLGTLGGKQLPSGELGFLEPAAEAQALIEGYVVAPLASYRLVKISGPDAKRFLQGQLTCDVEALSQHHSHLGCHCNHKGRVLANFLLMTVDDGYYLRLPLAMCDTLIDSLKKYAMFSQVSLTTSDWVGIGYHGEHCGQHLRAHYHDVPAQQGQLMEYDNSVVVCMEDDNSAYEIWGNASELTAVWAHLCQHSTAVSESVWRLQQIRHGIASIYPATSLSFTPHNINYDLVGGVSFTKGCYTGQEIIARTHYLGKVKQRMYRLVSQEVLPTLAPGDSVFSEQEVGVVIDCAINEQGQQELLAVIKNYQAQTDYFLDKDGTKSLQGLDLPYSL